MILKYSFSNFRSVGTEPVVIDFEATADKFLPGNLIDNTVNKACFIFGENGTGKSTIILSLEKLQHMVVEPLINRRKTIRDQQHVMFEDKPSTYDISFKTKGIKYDYSLSYLNSEILTESLYYSPNGRTTKIFTRERDSKSVSFGPGFEKDAVNIEGCFRLGRLILSIASSVTKIQPISDAYEFFNNMIKFMDKRDTREIIQRVGEFLTENPQYKPKMLELLKETKFDIEDIVIEKKIEALPSPMRFVDEPDDFFEDSYHGRERVFFDVYIRHSKFLLPLQDESSGTLNIMRLLIAFCRVMNNEMILLCDEPESSLHPILFHKLIQLFHNSEYNTNSQILCATHATEILDLRILRREQLFFSSINSENRTTRITRLSDIRGTRISENVEKSFLDGTYGKKIKDL